jgi:hypothetical protein
MSDNARACVRRPKPVKRAARAKEFSFRTSGDPAGGARRDRTDDLLLAKQALSQLSYGPFRKQASGIRYQADARHLMPDTWKLVGLGRFELPTSRLSSARSNQLSYKPVPGIGLSGIRHQDHQTT